MSSIGTATSTAPVASLVTTPLVVVSVIFPLLALGAIYGRYRARNVARQPFASDDWWIVASWILTLGSSIIVWVYANMMGVDYFKVSPLLGIEYSNGCLETASVYYQVPLAAVKISILLFYKRIFTTPKFKIAVWIAIAVVIIWGILFFFLVLCQLDPIAGAWIGQGTIRFNPVALGLAQCATSIVLDLVVLCFPLPVIHRLQMRKEKKLAIGLIFWLGLFCVIAAAVRLSLLYDSVTRVIETAAEGFSAVTDQWKQYIFMILEPNCAVIAACLPCYGPLFKGGRAPESLINSLRSVFSLRSRDSKGSSLDFSRERRGYREQSSSLHKDSVTESQIQLKEATHNWGRSHSQGTNTVRVENQSSKEGEELPEMPRAGISVTRDVNVTRN